MLTKKSNTDRDVEWATPEGAVSSVNNKTGAVVLTATDVGALPDSYVQTQADWEQSDNTKVDYIKNKPTIPTVNNATLTVQQNGTNVNTFTANASTDVTVNITVPTDTSDLTNGAGFLTTVPVTSVNSKTGAVVLSASDVGALSSSTHIPADQVQSDWEQSDDTKVDFIKNKPTIPTVNNSTITIQKNSTTVDSFTTNASSGKTINITVPTTASDVGALPSNTTYVSTVNGSSGAVTVQATLVGSGTGQNIKSINGSSILGSGDISLQTPLTAGTDYQTPLTIDSSLSTSSTNPVQNKAIGLLTTTGGSLGGVTTSTEGNQIALKGFVNSSINALAAYYITKNANGDPFATHAELAASTTVYSGGSARTPTRNDYCIVLADETNGSGDSTRYTYNSDSTTYSATNWAYQYTYNKQFTQAQMDALDSGITSTKVSKLDGIASGAEVNVQSDWSQTTVTADDYIKNKPTKLSDFSNDSGFTTNTGTVTSVSGGTGLTGTVTTTGSISLATSGVTAGSYGPSADSSPSHGGTFSVPYITVDTYGRTTAAADKTITLPSETSLSKGTTTGAGNAVTDISVSGHTITLTKGTTFSTTDTKNTAGSTAKTGTKMYLIGATAQDDNPQTYSNVNCYVGTDNCLYSGGNKVLTSYVDTKNTAGATDTASKIFLIGATSQGDNPQTYSQDTCYAGTDGHLYSDSKQVVNLSDSQALTNKTYNGYTLAGACAYGATTSVTSGSSDLVTSGAVYTSVSGKQAQHSVTTITIATTAWNSSTLTTSAQSVTGVTASNTVVVSPHPDDFTAYGEAGIYCSAQGSGTLTFKCTTVPSAAIKVNVMILS